MTPGQKWTSSSSSRRIKDKRNSPSLALSPSPSAARPRASQSNLELKLALVRSSGGCDLTRYLRHNPNGITGGLLGHSPVPQAPCGKMEVTTYTHITIHTDIYTHTITQTFLLKRASSGVEKKKCCTQPLSLLASAGRDDHFWTLAGI